MSYQAPSPAPLMRHEKKRAGIRVGLGATFNVQLLEENLMAPTINLGYEHPVSQNVALDGHVGYFKTSAANELLSVSLAVTSYKAGAAYQHKIQRKTYLFFGGRIGQSSASLGIEDKSVTKTAIFFEANAGLRYNSRKFDVGLELQKPFYQSNEELITETLMNTICPVGVVKINL